MAKNTDLPYTDTKPVGAADFYFAINATFRFIEESFGHEGLVRYWQEMGKSYFAPVTKKWSDGGLEAVASYWKAFFAAEPGGEVEIVINPDFVLLDVKCCPAIKHLRDNQREIVPCFCQHCYYVTDAMADTAGPTVRVEGGNGRCQQRFMIRTPNLAPQDLAQIKEAK